MLGSAYEHPLIGGKAGEFCCTDDLLMFASASSRRALTFELQVRGACGSQHACTLVGQQPGTPQPLGGLQPGLNCTATRDHALTVTAGDPSLSRRPQRQI